MKRSISIHDIARELNISATTVSYVLNGKGLEKRISTAMQKKIRQYVESVGYRPNHIAQSLRTGKTKVVGILVEDISDSFFARIARLIEEELYKSGYKIFHSSTNNETKRAKELLQMFRGRQVDGYIMAPAPGLEEDIISLLNESKPVILFDRYFPGLDTVNVMIDNLGGAYTGVEHLVENGFKNIAFVTLNSEQVQMKDRLKGYVQAIAQWSLPEYIQKIEYNTPPDEISSIVQTLLTNNPEIDAILFATNYLAVSGLSAMQSLGLQIPNDIGIVGFDDHAHFALFSPSITAVAQPIEAISKNIVQQLIQALSGIQSYPGNKSPLLSTQLIIRQSSVTGDGAKKLT